MKIAAALTVMLMATAAQSHPIHKASQGCTAFAMALFAYGDYLMHDSGADMQPTKDPGSYVMWSANSADQTYGERKCWRELAGLFKKK